MAKSAPQPSSAQPEVKFDLQPLEAEGEFDLQPVEAEQEFDLQEAAEESPKEALLSKVGRTALSAVNALDEIPGEAVRFAREGGELRLPSIVGQAIGEGSVDVEVPGGQVRLSTDKKPGSALEEIWNGIAGISGAISGPIQGKSPLQGAKEGVTRTKDSVPDLIGMLTIGFASGKAGSLGMETLAGKGIVAGSKGLTGAGKRVMNIVTKAKSSGDEIKAAINAEKAAKAVSSSPLEQAPLAVEPTGLSPKETESMFVKARTAEKKVEALTKELDDVLTSGPDGLAVSKQEQRWMGRIANLKAERDALAEQLTEKNMDAMLKPRNTKIMAQIDELSRIDKNEKLLKLTEKEDQIISQIKASGGLHSSDLDDKLKLIQQKKAEVVDNAHKRVKELAQSVLDDEDKALQEAAERLNKLDSLMDNLKGRYQSTKNQRFLQKRDSIMEAAAYAENDLKSLGYTSQEVQARFVNLMDRSGDIILLPETLTEARRTAGVTAKGTPISQDLVDGIMNQGRDINYFEQNFGGFKYITDDLDKVTNGAFKREVEWPLFNNVVKKRELEASFYTREAEIRSALKLTNEDSVPLRRFIEGVSAAPEGKAGVYSKAKEQYKKLYDELLDLVNEKRKQMNQPEIAKREDYVHHMRQEAVAEDLLLSPEEAQNYLSATKKQPKLGFEHKRTDAIAEDQLSGSFEAMSAYMSKALNYVAHAEDADKLFALQAQAQRAGKNNLARFFASMGTRLTGDAARLTNKGAELATGGAFNQKLGSLLMEGTKRFAKNVIVGNIGAAVNQIGSTVLASMYMGAGKAAKGTVEGMTMGLWEHIIKASSNPEYKSFAKQYSKAYELYKLEDAKRLAISGNKALEKMGMLLFNYMNEAMVVGTFNQAFRIAKKQGKGLDEAVKFADEIALRSNGVYEDVFRPAFVSKNSVLGRLMMPISTYTFNAANALAKDVVFSKLSKTEKLRVLAEVQATGVLTNLATNVITGRDSFQSEDFVPFLRPLQFGFGGVFSLVNPVGNKSITSKIAEGALLLANPYGFGLQAIKTAKGTANILSGDNMDPRQIYSGPLKKDK